MSKPQKTYLQRVVISNRVFFHLVQIGYGHGEFKGSRREVWERARMRFLLAQICVEDAIAKARLESMA